ncbi:MAG: glycosyltransferase family 4 protein, partial [Planctomycetes bacterium]|nr:glycosyltransferase family 4 protein [Planctomycetota bacterium]
PGLHLIQVGQLIERKRVAVTLDALAQLGAAAHLTVIGDGPLRGALDAQARALGIADRVDFAGHLPRATILERLRLHDVFVMTSVAEGMSNAMVEAMAAGLPIVSTTVGGIPEMVEPDGNGYLITPGDHVALADALTALVGDAQRRECFGVRSRELVAQRFELGLITRRLRRVYAAVARRPGVPEPVVCARAQP